MHHTPPSCPLCGLNNAYPDGQQLICPDCGFEWLAAPLATDSDDAANAHVVRDANGNPLIDGDAVILIKDLKVKGASATLKKGTKIKGIRIADGADGHNIDCKTDLGNLLLKSEFLRKA